MKHVIIGAGPAGVIAAETLRKAEPEAEIILVGGEDEPPYSRMAIPYFLSGKVKEEGTYLRREADHYEKLDIRFLRDARATKIDSSAREITLDRGDPLAYDRLLVATGSRPVTPPIPGIDHEVVLPCWTLADARKVHDLAREGANVVLIGAGFIGTIVLDAIGSRDINLTVIEVEDRMVPRMMNHAGGEVIKKWCGGKGVEVLTSTRVESLEPGGGRKVRLKLDNGTTLDADLVVTATGVEPIVDFLEGSGVEVEQGVLVNERMQSSVPEIYAAGDVAQGKDFSLEANAVHAIQPTASEHARIAALNMAGQEAVYRGSLSMNVVETLGLVHYTFGQWMGVEGGQRGEALDAEHSKYLLLEFSGDTLVGAINVGQFEHVGVLRGLIQSRIALGEWKDELVKDPTRVMEAYLFLTKSGQAPPRMSAVSG